MTPQSAIRDPQSEIPRDRCTTAQMRALFAAANGRGMSHDDLRAMCPNGHVSQLSFNQASDLLNRLNGRHLTPGESPGAKYARRRKRRRAANTFAPFSDEQRDLIDRKLRIALGWTPAQMRDHLVERHYTSDPTRSMDSIVSTTDGVAVAEHLKKVLRRTLEGHALHLKKYPPVDGLDIAGLMRTLPPYERLSTLLAMRLAELAAKMHSPSVDQWLDTQRLTDGRGLRHVAFCSDAAELIYRIESKLRELKRHDLQDEHDSNPVNPVNPVPSDAPERNYKFPGVPR